MDAISTLFTRRPRNNRPDASTPSTNSGSIRHKWPHHRIRPKPRNKSTSESATTVTDVNSDAESTMMMGEFYPGLVRVPANDCCVVCANDLDYLYVFSKCGHRACLDCWCRFAASQVSSFAMAHITCIACDRHLPSALTLQLLKPRLPTDLQSTHSAFSASKDASTTPPPLPSLQQQIADEKLFRRYDEFLLHQCLLRDKHTRWCPRGCGYAVLAGHGFRECPRLECQNPDCPVEAFCYKCRGPLQGDGRDHNCKRADGAAGADAGDIFEYHRSVLSRLQQFFRLPTATASTAAPATTTEAAAAAARGKTGDLEGSLEEGRLRNPSEISLTTNAIPVRASVTSNGSDDEDGVRADSEDDSDDDVMVDQAPKSAELELPDDLNGQVKPCPRCKTLLLKLNDGSCNHMSCFICGCEFCWLCLREVRDTHFLSPTGCTFWGRSRWPIRRRICAMLLAAFGTPFILTLVTALAIPGITFGFPAYLVFRVGKNTKSKKWVRILLKTLAFAGGLLFSPIIAALVALFGIPLVLIYVYIFMPITLFSELKFRLSSDEPSEPVAVDPDAGFKVNWDRVGASLGTRSSAASPTPKKEESEAASKESKKKKKRKSSKKESKAARSGKPVETAAVTSVEVVQEWPVESDL